MNKLLIIDDEQVFLESISSQLKLRGFDVITRTSGKDVEQLIKKDESIDVVLLDLKMPDMDGEEVLKRIKETRPEVQVVILTGHGDTESAVQLARMDAFSYLQKPVELEKLIDVLKKARSKATFLIAETKGKKGKPAKVIVFQLLLSIGVGLLIYLLPTPAGLSPQGHRFLAFLLSVIFLWITEAIPIGVTALLVGGGLVLFGIQKPEAAWSPFASPAVMFVMMIIMFGVIINEVGLTNRILYGILKIGGRKLIPFSLFLCIVSSLLSSVFHDATITIIFLFSMIPIFNKLNITPYTSNNFSKFMTILIPLSASAGGFGTILGGGRNPIAVEFLEKHMGIHIGFVEFLICQLPIVIFVSLTTWIICYLIFPPKLTELPSEIQSAKLPPMTKREKGVAFIFALAFIFWSLGDLTHLHVSVIAALSIIAICGLGYVKFKTIIEKFAWDAWLVFGAGVSLGVAMLDTGAGKWLADQFAPLLYGQSKLVQYFGIGIFSSFISSFMSNSAATALCLPIMYPMAAELGLSVKHITLILPAATSFIWLVIGCPPSIIAYSTGYFSQVDFIKVSILWAIACVFVYSLIISFYWPLIGF
ncbi:DASS family sodium-coupled anion symporter [Bacteroidetes/Chlorobi group bacterium MS-B_bin-24]|jgi:sodium-dependent dicarboxylate transporter 2/3/5|nr:MAG: DASS family sodium-coupled anion symporter [Bacteroidetes/Chlorobi group bacterium MS-B_bin-24]